MTKSLEELRPTDIFTGHAAVYAKSRPAYPAQAIDFILSRCNLSPGAVVADIGCGTGISSRQLAERELQVVGIDPNEDMRLLAESEPSISLYPITYNHGTSEQTGLATASVDAIVAAQAFHWFKPKEAFKEFHRILKPGGCLVVMYNRHDESDPFTAATQKVMRTWPGTESVEKIGGAVEDYLSKTRFFSYEGLETFHNSQKLSEEGLVTRFRSNPFFPKDSKGEETSIRELTELFARYSTNSEVHLCLKTRIYLAKRVEVFGEMLRKRLGLK